jgi:hypothetical protein
VIVTEQIANTQFITEPNGFDEEQIRAQLMFAVCLDKFSELPYDQE